MTYLQRIQRLSDFITSQNRFRFQIFDEGFRQAQNMEGLVSRLRTNALKLSALHQKCLSSGTARRTKIIGLCYYVPTYWKLIWWTTTGNLIKHHICLIHSFRKKKNQFIAVSSSETLWTIVLESLVGSIG